MDYYRRDGDYPPGVTDAMIAEYFGDNDQRCCKNCINYYKCDGECRLKWNKLEDMPEDEYDAMTEKERKDFVEVPEDGFCDDYEYEDDGPEEEW